VPQQICLRHSHPINRAPNRLVNQLHNLLAILQRSQRISLRTNQLVSLALNRLLFHLKIHRHNHPVNLVFSQLVNRLHSLQAILQRSQQVCQVISRQYNPQVNRLRSLQVNRLCNLH
jgi:hypothetical protein